MPLMFNIFLILTSLLSYFEDMNPESWVAILESWILSKLVQYYNNVKQKRLDHYRKRQETEIAPLLSESA